MADTLFATITQSQEEILSHTIGVFAAKEDPIWQETESSFQGVTPVDEISKDFVIHKIFRNEVSGINVEPMYARSDLSLRGDAAGMQEISGKLLKQSVSDFYPDPFDVAETNDYRLSIPMAGFMLDMGMTMAEMQADSSPFFLAKRGPIKMAGAARRMARVLTEAWYTSQAENYKLCSIGAAGSTDTTYALAGGATDGAITTLTFRPTNEAFGRLYVGMMVDLVKDSGGAPVRINETSDADGKRIKGWVSMVDPLRGRAQVAFFGDNDDASASGASANAFGPAGADAVFTTTAIGSSAYLIPTFGYKAYKNSAPYFKGIAGFHSWAKFGSSATNSDKRLLGAEAYGSETGTGGIVNVETHPEFRSALFSSVGALTETKLGKYLARFYAAFQQFDYFLDELVTTEGVIQSYLQSKIGVHWIDRTNRVADLKNEGNMSDVIVFNYNGRQHRIRTSRWMDEGTLIGYRRQGNWTRFVPPKPADYKPGMGLKPFLDVRFIAPALTGLNSIRLPYLRSGQYTLGARHPAHCHLQFVPTTQVNGMKLTGISYDRVFSELAS